MLQRNDFYWYLIDLFFPPRCGGCERWGERYCDNCWENTIAIEGLLCQICGEPVKSQEKSKCDRCNSINRYFDGVRSWAHYEGPLKKAIQKLKYKKDIGLARCLVQPLFELLKIMDWQVNLITAVPLDKVKLSLRGYNQAELLSKSIAWGTGVPFVSDAVIKRIPTRSQVGLSEVERLANLIDVFWSNPNIVKGIKVLIVDDVVTTGATMDACSSALKRSGAVEVYGISLARALRL